jgi:hypothetical protein
MGFQNKMLPTPLVQLRAKLEFTTNKNPITFYVKPTFNYFFLF